MSKSKHIWIEKLTVFKCLWILIYKKKFKIFYISTSLLSRYLLNFFPNIKFVQIQLGILDTEGKALIYEVEKKTQNYVLKIHDLLSLQQCTPGSIKFFQDEWQRILKSHLDLLIKKKLTMILFIKQKYENSFLEKVDHIDFIAENFMFENIFYKILNEDIQTITFKVWPNFFGIFNRIKEFLKFFALIIVSVFYKFFRYDYKVIENKPHIFEEHIFNIFDRYPDAGHLYWFESSKIDPNNLVLYFDRRDLKINKKLNKQIKDRKMHALNMIHPALNVDNPLNIFIETLKDIKFFEKLSLNKIDIWLTQIKYIYLIKCFRQVFKRYNCKIVHQHQEFWPKTLTMALSLRMEKGVFIWNHWSVDHFPISYFHWGFADIIFSWGEYNDGYFNSHNFSYKYLFQTGLIGADGNYKLSNDEEKKFNGKLSNNLNLIINILDSTYGPNHQNSYSSMLYFYREILKNVYENKTWGGIIKSKGKAFEKIMHDKEILNFVKKLKKENRLLILPSSLKVSVSAKISDISVCYGINSAGILSALSGSKSIYWDLPGASEHPLYYLDKKNNLVFKTIHEINDALDSFILGNKEIGNHDDCLYLFDSFCDDQGRYRAGEIISKLFFYLNNNLEFDESMNKIKNEYEIKWGKKFVYKFGLGLDHEGNQLWHRAQNNVKK